MENIQPIIQVKNLGVNIKMDEGLLTPVRGVDFEIHPGETLGLVGESGCGKSLTSKAILAINEKKCTATGEILFEDGHVLSKEDARLLDTVGVAEVTVEVDGQTVDKEMTLICVCNGQYYGGGFHPVPEADPTDGLLDVLLIEKVSRLKVAQVIGKFKDGRYKELPKLVRHIKTDRLTIRCDRPSAINLDGELRISDVVDIRVADEKIRFFYPKGLTY